MKGFIRQLSGCEIRPDVATQVLHPNQKYISMTRKMNRIDSVLNSIKKEQEDDREKLQQLMEQADNLSARVINSFKKCVNIREEINVSTGESSVLVERKSPARKIHWCGPRQNNPEDASLSPKRKTSAERLRQAEAELIKMPMTPNNLNESYSKYEKLARFRRLQQSPPKTRMHSQSTIVKPKTRREGDGSKRKTATQAKENISPETNRLRANLLSFIIFLAGIMVIAKLL